MRVLLDAGHYGKRNQSPVVPEYYESDFTWKHHLMLKEELEKYPLFSVDVTRENQNQDLEVFERGQMAEGYDLLLSSHSNASDDEEKDRVAMYHQVPDDTDGEHTEISKAVAEALAPVVNDVMECKGNCKATYRKSEHDRDKDGTKDDYYALLRGAAFVKCPAVIMEHSYHTNKRATLWLLDDENIRKLAKKEAETLAKLYGAEKPNCNTATVKLPILKKGDKNEAVKTVQILLNAKGYDVGKSGADGIFGNKTKDAVKKFQKSKSISPNGEVGEIEWNALLGGLK
jgi:N-acetylmuramoyl-L-alanine amidase